MPTEAPAHATTGIAAVLAAGVVAAVHVGKLPPALPLIRAEFDLGLVAAGWLVAMTQLAGALLALPGGALSDRIGPRRTMLAGLLLLAAGGLLGAAAPDAAWLLGARVAESLGLLLAVLPAPALLGRLAAPAGLPMVMGAWGAHMPVGVALALLAAAAGLAATGWRAGWIACAALAGAAAALLVATVPPDRAAPPAAGGAARSGTARASSTRIRDVVTHPAPWLLTACFACYSSQWIGVFSFLPTLYRDEGLSLADASLLTAAGVAANAVGNLAGGALLRRGVPRGRLLALAAGAMLACAWLAFGSGAPLAVRFAAVVGFSSFGGLIPATLFASVVAFAPHPGAVSTTAGLMLQGSSIGQLASPPLLAAVAAATGGWRHGWIATGTFACGGLVTAWLIGRRERGVGRG